MAININYLFDQIKNEDILGAFFSLATGTVPLPSEQVVSGNISSSGEADGFDGPGQIVIAGNKITVKSPDSVIWGYNTPYIQAEKTTDGIDIINNKSGEKIKHIAAADISNDTIDSDYVSGDSVKSWYNESKEGAKMNIEYAVGGLSDNRSLLTPEILKEKFPEAYNYSTRYPSNSPVLVYETNHTSNVISYSYTYLGSHPQYNDANREYNAKQFVKAWNNTIIPAGASGCGQEGVSFSSVVEPDAESGTATHGVCPPARTLRTTVMALGFSLPVGMDTGEDAVLFGFSPSTGIKITNSLDYPIKILMWTEGSGTGMKICSEVQEYVPNNETPDVTNKTSSETETVAG